jgi:hypothetical protein
MFFILKLNLPTAQILNKIKPLSYFITINTIKHSHSHPEPCTLRAKLALPFIMCRSYTIQIGKLDEFGQILPNLAKLALPLIICQTYTLKVGKFSEFCQILPNLAKSGKIGTPPHSLPIVHP